MILKWISPARWAVCMKLVIQKCKHALQQPATRRNVMGTHWTKATAVNVGTCYLAMIGNAKIHATIWRTAERPRRDAQVAQQRRLFNATQMQPATIDQIRAAGQTSITNLEKIARRFVIQSYIRAETADINFVSTNKKGNVMPSSGTSRKLFGSATKLIDKL
mmetsp:Transcript_93937/g.180603  ORF Transcript_93937/g.180603 Transcript_93937/m.180603 type:complete len:162 (-) Transcript_93937:4536-5021(-)